MLAVSPAVHKTLLTPMMPTLCSHGAHDARLHASAKDAGQLLTMLMMPKLHAAGTRDAKLDAGCLPSVCLAARHAKAKASSDSAETLAVLLLVRLQASLRCQPLQTGGWKYQDSGGVH